MMRCCLVAFFLLVSAGLSRAQSGPCTEGAIKQGKLPMADDAFSYMPPYGKPVTGQSAIHDTAQSKFSDRTNVTNSWVGERRIVVSPSGDMAYEHGTMRVTYDDKDGHHQFDAVMLTVYKAKGGVCQMAAGTMQPLEESIKP
jgi:hypothetical protein